MHPILSRIDYAILRPDAARKDILSACALAKRYGFAAVCVNPALVPIAATALSNSSVAVCAAIGFPLGATLPEVKTLEAALAVRLGAREVDVVINIGRARMRDYSYIQRELEAIRATVGPQVVTKAIIELPLLRSDEVSNVVEAVIAAGFDFLKTSTGFGKWARPVTPDDIRLLVKLAAGRAKV
ncbi:deoxyribose-phosphate aldolase, partial [archaeon]|nr:deoxyribose-phosphate aldolase [archaeon]